MRSYLFSSDAAAPLHRRPVDYWRLFLTGALFLLLGWAARAEPPLDSSVEDFFAATPDWLRVLGWIAYTGAGIAAVGLIVATLFRGGIGRGLFRDLALTVVFAVGLALIAARVATGTWPNFLPEIFDAVDGPAYPTARTAFVVAVVSAQAPYLTYSVRKFGWWVIGAAVLSPILLGLSTVTGALGALALSAFSVAAVRVIFGSPEGLPPVDRLSDALERVGVSTKGLSYLPEQPGTVGLATAEATDGRELTIKVYGRDAADRERSERFWKSLWYRSSGPAPVSGRVQQVEHEALALLVAERAEVDVPELVEAGQEEGGDVLLVVVEPEGIPLGEMSGGELGDDQLRELWQSLGRLQDVKLTHGAIGARTVRFGPDGPSLVDFNHSSLLPTPNQYGADVAALLGSSAVVVGPKRAVDGALSGMSRARLDAALPFVQDAVVDPSLRSWMKRSKVKFDAIRALLVEHLGVDAPELAEVRRVKGQDVLMMIFAVIAANALISQIAQIGFGTLVDELRAASFGWLVAAFLIMLAGYSTPYIGLSAAVTQPVPYAPTVMLQSANSFVGLVLPSTVGRVAMDVRFLQKLGVSTTTAVAQGPVISFFGFLIEIALLLLSGWAIGQAIDTDSLADQDSGGLLGIVAAVVIIGVIVIAAVPKLRDKVVPKVKEAYHSVRSVITSPSRLGRICFSEFLEKMVSALALGAVVAAFGASVPFTALIFVSVGTGLLAGLAPVPGGVGVAEATLTALLTAVGLPAEQSFSIAITYRVITSYLPPVLGFFSLKVMTEKGYI